MGVYVQPGLETDPSVLRERAVAFIEDNLPGFDANEPSLANLIIDALSLTGAEQAVMAAEQRTSDFRSFGSLVSLPALEAIPPVVTAVFHVTASVTEGTTFTIPAGSVVGLRDSSGTLQGFMVREDIIVAEGATEATAELEAEQPGTAANGLSGEAELVQVPAAVTEVVLETSHGGIEAEADEVYLGRLTETLELLSPTFTLAKDAAVLARTVPGVWRATGVDNLKPGPPYDEAEEAAEEEKHVTVAVADVDGQSVGSSVRAAATSYLQSLREQNFKVWVVDPKYQSIDVKVVGTALPGYDPTGVQEAVQAALEGALSPAYYGTEVNAPAARWLNEPILRKAFLDQVVSNVTGVRYISELTFRKHGEGGYGVADINLGDTSLIPALPEPGTLAVTIT